MIGNLFLPGLLNTGAISKELMVIRDGFVNSYVLFSNTGLICVDAGWRKSLVSASFGSLGLNPQDVKAVLLTHLHWDHSGCLSLFPQADVILSEHEVSPVLSRRNHRLRPITGEQRMMIDGLTVHILPTPGHSPGSLSYLVNNALLFTGDTVRLRQGKVLPFLFPFNDSNRALHQSILKLAGLEGVECLLTAHSGMSRTLDGAFSTWRRSPENARQGGAGS